MDKELLRVVIIATGLMVMVGMLLWSYLKNKKASEDMDFFDDQEFMGEINESLVVHTDNDDFDVVPVKSTRHEVDDASDQLLEDYDEIELEEEDSEPSPRFVAPAIIQFSIVAKAEEGFNGLDLLNAFQIVGLEYGNLKIFERLDDNRRVDFCVACMVEPGTFPSTNLKHFFCPGIVFFMQPGVLDNAAAVFEDFLETVNLLAIELDGDVLDHQRKPLTNATLQLIRQSL